MHSEAPESILSGTYRAVWRWHFYAGLLVLPVLMLMALTGGVYLFRAEIDGALYHRMAQVQAGSASTAPEAWVSTTERATGGTVTTLTLPDRADRAVRLTTEQPDGDKRIAFVDPHTGRLTGTTAFRGVTEIVKELHSLTLLGQWANYAVEIVAGWAIVLFATGLFLWWPRRRPVGVVALTTTDPKRRPFWRDLHALTGLYAGGIIAFLAITGMPWSAFWGQQYAAVVRETGVGRPKAPAAASPWAHARHKGDAPVGVGWTMEGMVMPSPDVAPPRLSRVIAAADAHQLARPYTVSIPASPDLAFTAARQVTQVQDTRSLYIDGASGAVKADIAYGQFGIGAKAFEWGVAVHQGTQYGWINRYVMLSGCLAVWILGISGIVMWWKRRPKGRLAAPVAPPGPHVRAAVLGIVLPLCILYPLTGLSLLVAVGLDRVIAAIRRARPVAS